MTENYLLRTGKRLNSNDVKVQHTKNGQYSMTIPIWVARSVNIKTGSIVRYEVLKTGGFKIQVIS